MQLTVCPLFLDLWLIPTKQRIHHSCSWVPPRPLFLFSAISHSLSIHFKLMIMLCNLQLVHDSQTYNYEAKNTARHAAMSRRVLYVRFSEVSRSLSIDSKPYFLSFGFYFVNLKLLFLKNNTKIYMKYSKNIHEKIKSLFLSKRL